MTDTNPKEVFMKDIEYEIDNKLRDKIGVVLLQNIIPDILAKNYQVVKSDCEYTLSITVKSVPDAVFGIWASNDFLGRNSRKICIEKVTYTKNFGKDRWKSYLSDTYSHIRNIIQTKHEEAAKILEKEYMDKLKNKLPR